MSRRENDQRFWEVVQFINRYYDIANERMHELWKKQAEEYQAFVDSEKSSQVGPTTVPFPALLETPRTENDVLRTILEQMARLLFKGQQDALAVIRQAVSSGQISSSSAPVLIRAVERAFSGPDVLQQFRQAYSERPVRSEPVAPQQPDWSAPEPSAPQQPEPSAPPSWSEPSAPPQPESTAPTSQEQEFQTFHRETEARYHEAATQAQTQTDMMSMQALMRLTLDVRFLRSVSMEMRSSDSATLSRDSLFIVRECKDYQTVRDNTVIALSEVKTFQYDPRFFQSNPFNIQPQPGIRREVEERDERRLGLSF